MPSPFALRLPKATNQQGQLDGKIYFAGTTQFATGFSPSVTLFVMPTAGGLIRQFPVQLTPVMPSPPGLMTFSFGTAAAPLPTDQLPNKTYSVWALLYLSNGTTKVYVSTAWASVAITQGAGQTGEGGSVTATGGQNGANQIVGTVAVTIPDPYNATTNPTGWSIDGNLALYGLQSGSPVGPGLIALNNAAAVNNQAMITLTNVPAGTYKLFGVASIKQGGGVSQLIGSPLSADYTVSNP